MLAAGTKRWYEYKPYALRVVEAQTAGAYAITRQFATVLHRNWLACLSHFDNPNLGRPVVERADASAQLVLSVSTCCHATPWIFRH